MSGEWVIEIRGKRPRKPGEAHWSVIQRQKREWTEYLSWQVRAGKLEPCEPGEYRRVEITFYRPGPVSDKDNAHAACKVPLDAMQRAGIIENDSPKCIDLQVATVSAGKSRIVLRITRAKRPDTLF